MQHSGPSTVDRLGLAGWTTHGVARRASLGSLSSSLGAFLPAPDLRALIPAQRTLTVLEAR